MDKKRPSFKPGAPDKAFKAKTDRPAASFDKKPFKRKEDGEGSSFRGREEGDRPFKDRRPSKFGDDSRGNRDAKPFRKREDGDKPFRDKKPARFDDRGGDRDAKPFRKREDGDKPFRDKKPARFDDRGGDRDAKPFRKREDGNKPFGEKRPARFDNDNRSDRDEKPFRKREDGDKPFKDKKPARFDDRAGDREERPFRKREEGDKPFREKRPSKFGDDKRGNRGDKPFRKREEGDKPFDKEKKPTRFSDHDPFKEERVAKPGEEERPKKTGVTFSKGLDEVQPFMKPKRNARFGNKDGHETDDRSYTDRKEARPGKKPVSGKKPFAGMPDHKKSKEDHRNDSRYTQREEYELAARQNDREYFGDDDEWRSDKDTRKKVETAATFPMPLNKYIAHSGECSRRDAAELVKQGKVKVNGELILEPGHKVNKDDQVTLVGKKLTPQKGLIYVLLNKPKGFITTNEDERGRKTVMDLVANADAGRLFPVGRLDRATTGLLLLTNDGALTQKLSHPSYDIKKVYHVTLDKPLTKAHFEQVLAGIELEDGKTEVDELAYLEKKNELGLEIHSGKNRIVRRIFESLGYVVEKLDRMMYAGLTKKNLPRGKWRYLNEEEIRILKHFKS